MRNSAEKSRRAYDEIADTYDNSPEGAFTAEFQRLLLSVMEIKDGDNVLDVACGNGSLLASVNRLTHINGFGADISERMIENAARRNPGMEFHAAGCDKLPFADSSMDIITVCAAYHHFPDVNAFAFEAGRVLKPGGSIYIVEVFLPTVLRVIVNPFMPLMNKGDVKLYSPSGIAKTFAGAGFKHARTVRQGHIQIVRLILM